MARVRALLRRTQRSVAAAGAAAASTTWSWTSAATRRASRASEIEMTRKEFATLRLLAARAGDGGDARRAAERGVGIRVESGQPHRGQPHRLARAPSSRRCRRSRGAFRRCTASATSSCADEKSTGVRHGHDDYSRVCCVGSRRGGLAMTRQVVLRLALVLLAPAALFAQSALEIYQRALVQDQAAGNLKEAIALYRRAATEAGADRALAATRARPRRRRRGEAGRSACGGHLHAGAPHLHRAARAGGRGAGPSGVAAAVAGARRRASAARAERVELATVDVALETYCVGCHNPRQRTANLDLQTLRTKASRRIRRRGAGAAAAARAP